MENRRLPRRRIHPRRLRSRLRLRHRKPAKQSRRRDDKSHSHHFSLPHQTAKNGDSVPRRPQFGKVHLPAAPPWTERAVPTFRPGPYNHENREKWGLPTRSQGARNSARFTCLLRRRGQSGPSPLFAPALIAIKPRKMGTACSVPRRPQFGKVHMPAAPPWTERALPTFRPGPYSHKTAKNGDCLLCPKAPAIRQGSHTCCAAVDRAGCPHFSPRPL